MRRKGSETVSGAKIGRPAAHPRVLPAPRPLARPRNRRCQGRTTPARTGQRGRKERERPGHLPPKGNPADRAPAETFPERKPGTTGAASKAGPDREIDGQNPPITGQKSPGTAATKSRRKLLSGPKIGRPERNTGTDQDRRPDRGGNGPENTRSGAENRAFSGPPEFDKKLHRSTANLDSIS